jgi:hypothetical protein
MMRRALATRFDRLAESGRNEPLRMAVATGDGVEHDVFLKPSGRPEMGIEGMANEALAAMLASELNLPINEAFFVELTPDFVAAIPNPEVRQVLGKSSRVCFASKNAGNQWALWTPGEQLLSDRIPTALAITVFDALIENEDRKAQKPNLLVKSGQFRIIDHEMAFYLRMKLFPRPEPWKLGYFNKLIESGGHVLAVKLKKASEPLDFAPIKKAWLGLSDELLQSYLAALPAEWASAQPAMQDAVSHIKAVRSRIDECVGEIGRALT